jgi:hypothetical protein
MHTLIHRLRQDLDAQVMTLDRGAITPWLMAFSAKTPLRLNHPHLGQIAYDGVAFWGSPAEAYDHYVAYNIEALTDQYLRVVEDQLAEVAREDRSAFADDASRALNQAHGRLIRRAEEVKGRLLADGRAPKPSTIDYYGVARIPIDTRLTIRLAALRRAELKTLAIAPSTLTRLADGVRAMRLASDGSFARQAKRLSAILRGDPLGPVRDELTAKVNFESFLRAAEAQADDLGDPLPWPGPGDEELGLVIGLIDYLAQDEERALDLAFNFYADGSANIAAWRNLVDQVIVPWERDLVDYLERMGLLAPAVPLAGSVHVHTQGDGPVSVLAHSPGATQNVSVTLESTAIVTRLEAFAAALAPLALDPGVRQNAEAEIDTLRAQLRKAKPNGVILTEGGRTLRSIAENIIATVVAPPALVASAAALWSVLGLG